MRYDYLYKFYPYYSDNGFKKLMNEGSNFTFAHFNYVPTYTAPGHSSIYTGTTPYYHGIIANNWYDRSRKKQFIALMIQLKKPLEAKMMKAKCLQEDY